MHDPTGTGWDVAATYDNLLLTLSTVDFRLD
jgi:hypothetical protein